MNKLIIKVTLSVLLASSILWGGDSERPNIIFMLADDMRADAAGFMGNPVISTPNLDQLASKGLIFKTAFNTTPICAVSRATIFTGQYAKTNGVHNFSTPVNLDNIYPMLLQDNGYQVGFMGKWGVNAKQDSYVNKVARRFDYWGGSTYQSNYFHEKDCSYVNHNGFKNRTAFRCDCPPDAGGRAGESIRTGFANMVDPIHLETYVFPKKMEEFLEGRDEGKPFCMSISYKSPHGPWQDWDRMFQNALDGVTIPMKPTATLEVALSQPMFLQNTLESDRARKWMRNNHYNSWYTHYYKSVMTMDHSIGKIVNLLKEHKLDDNTIIIFMSDNGQFMGEHGLSGKWLLYEESIQTPFLIFDPRVSEEHQGIVSEEIALNVDVYKTIADFADVEVPDFIQGESLAPLVTNPNKPLRDGTFLEHHFTLSPPNEILKSEGYRTKRWKYIRYYDLDPIVEQLFDLENDILEEYDLAQKSEYQSVLNEMRNKWQTASEELAR